MKLKIFAGIMLAATLPITASAKVNEVKVDLKKNSFEISGKISNGLSGKSVKLVVINPGYTIDDLDGDKFSESLYLADETKTDENGEYAFSAKLAKKAVSGDYKIYVQDDDGDVYESFERYYADDDYKKEVVKYINGADENTMETMLNMATEPLALDKSLIQTIGGEYVSKLVYEYKQNTKFDENDPNGAADELSGLIILAAYNKGLSEICFKDGEFLHDDVLDFSKTDEKGISAYESYTSILSEKGKERVRNGLLKNDFKNVSQARKKFLQLTVLYGINNSKDDGTGHIEKLLTKENAIALGVSFDSYIDMKLATARKNVETDLMKETFQTPEDLEETIDKLVKKYSKSSSGGGNTSSNTGSTGSSGDGTVPIENIDKKLSFDDIESVAWAKEAIEYLYNNKMISGVGANKFAPQKEITREQFTVMLVNALGLELNEVAEGFTDVTDGDYFTRHVAAAKKAVIINGITETRFGTGEKITREDMCTMIYRAYFNGKEATKELTFTDSESISSYAKKCVEYLSENNIVNGFDNGTFAPKSFCTRAQAAKVLYAVLTLEK